MLCAEANRAQRAEVGVVGDLAQRRREPLLRGRQGEVRRRRGPPGPPSGRPRSARRRRPVSAGPSTRTLDSFTSGAIERMIPAHAVPWPETSPASSSRTSTRSPSAWITTARSSRQFTSGWSASTPESTMHTRTPSPRASPNAHSRDISRGHAPGSATGGIASWVSEYAGRPASSPLKDGLDGTAGSFQPSRLVRATSRRGRCARARRHALRGRCRCRRCGPRRPARRPR